MDLRNASCIESYTTLLYSWTMSQTRVYWQRLAQDLALAIVTVKSPLGWPTVFEVQGNNGEFVPSWSTLHWGRVGGCLGGHHIGGGWGGVANRRPYIYIYMYTYIQAHWTGTVCLFISFMYFKPWWKIPPFTLVSAIDPGFQDETNPLNLHLEVRNVWFSERVGENVCYSLVRNFSSLDNGPLKTLRF